MRLASAEQVSKYHPDKYADQISDAILDAYLQKDKKARVAVETMVKDNTVVLGGEIRSNASVDVTETVHRVAKKLGYQVDKIINLLGKQSNQISNAVDQDEDTKAGDQGVMIGYACNETEAMLPEAFDLANKIIEAIHQDLKTPGTILKGDAKTQVTVDLDETEPERRVKTILISACHVPGITTKTLEQYLRILLASHKIKVYKETRFIVNPAGEWTVGGPTADCGLTGRKIVCDQYGGFVMVGGGAFSGKDPSKVDRSAAYAARRLATDILKKHQVDSVIVQLAYAIGIAEPVSIMVSTGDDTRDAAITAEIDPHEFTPKRIIERLDLLNRRYETIAEGCHYRESFW